MEQHALGAAPALGSRKTETGSLDAGHFLASDIQASSTEGEWLPVRRSGENPADAALVNSMKCLRRQKADRCYILPANRTAPGLHTPSACLPYRRRKPAWTMAEQA